MLFHPKAYNSALNLRSDACVKKGHPSKHHKFATVTGKASLYCVESVVARRGRTENDKGMPQKCPHRLIKSLSTVL